MQVSHCLIQEIVLDNGAMTGVSRSVLYDFGDPTWVSPHERVNAKFLGDGPISILDVENAEKTPPDPNKQVFPHRSLPTKWGDPIQISFSELWTVPPWTLYVLVLPEAFVANSIVLKMKNEGLTQLELSMEARERRRLFYYFLFQWAEDRHVFEISAFLERNPKAFEDKCNDVRLIQHTSELERLLRSLFTEKNFDRLMKLVPLAKLFGG
jgi:hypothetical protein